MTVAWTALILWPLICIVVYRRTTLPVALCVTIIGGYLLLPSEVSWNPPVLPQFDKTTIPAFAALVLTAIAIGSKDRTWFVLEGWIPRDPIILTLLAMFTLGLFGTVFTNLDPLFYGSRVLPGMSIYDGFSLVLDALVTLIPFFLGRRVLATPEGHRILLLTLAISALIYTVPTLYELRMSPQLHRMVYGFFPHSWLQAVRSGGYRPSVFLGHGLSLSLFMALAMIATAGLFRAGTSPDRLKWIFATVFLLAILVLCKSLGPLWVAVIIVAVMIIFSARMQLVIAACLAGTVMLYPALRATNIAPVYQVVDLVESVSPGRSGTFLFRLQNEDSLLEKANQRPVFGWGSWSRNRVHNEYGQDVTVIDGVWIGAVGTGGWMRYISLFGLLCWPIIALFLRRRSYTDPFSVTLILLLLANVIDLIPNSGLLPLTWLMAGALVGRLELGHTTGEPAPAPVDDPPSGKLRYARNFPDKRKKPISAASNQIDTNRRAYRRPKPPSVYRQ